MAKPPEVDVDTINALLDVINATANKHPNLSAITQAATLALLKINEGLAEELAEYNEAVAEEIAEAKAKAAEEYEKEKEDA